jgi:predicted nucleotidyltransferase
MKIATGVEIADSDLSAICRKYGVKELAVFGSAARGELRAESDVDLLVEFKPEARPGLLGLSALGREFSEVFGRRVDVAVKAALKPLVRKEILSEAHVIYAEG